MKKNIKMVLCLILPMVLLAFTACSGGGSGTLTVVTASTSVVQASAVDTQIVSYSVTLQNKSGVSLYIDEVGPLPSSGLEPKLKADYLMRGVNQPRLAPGQTLDVSGTFSFDATGMTKADIDKLQPFVTGYRVVYDETVPVPGK